MVKYDSYKDSRVEWIGEIPSHWILNKVGNNTYVKGRIGWKGLRSEDFIDEGPYLITGTDFNNDGSINWDKMYHVCQERYDEDPFIQLKDHDVLITKDGTIGKVVYVGELKGQTCLNSGIFLTRPLINEYIPKYFYWVLNSNVFKVFVDYNSGGSTIQHLYQNVFVNFKIPLPSIPEQIQIVQFLDTKTNLIDTLIQKTQEKIDLLREKRTSVINHTVTKGLNPNVEMKDSGMDLVGKIPKHWEVSKLKYYGQFFSGYSFDSNDFLSEGNVRVVKISNIQNEGINWDDLSFVPDDFYEKYSGFKVFKGDLVFVLTRPIISTGIKVCFYDCEFQTLLNQRNSVYRSNENLLIKQFLFYLVRSFYFVDDFKLQLKETNQPNISTEQISNIRIYLPSVQEQQNIVEYLDKQTELIDTLIQKEEIRVDLLKEYRQTLISDVVTGKIRVNG